MTESRQQKFWNRIAGRYAARPIKNVAAYEAMLSDAASRLNADDSVLEIGCGTGGTAIRLAPCVRKYTATDYSAEMVRIASAKPAPANLHFSVAEAGNALESGPFDAICAFNVLHLVDDLPELLARIHTHLHSDGLLISKTWCFADLGLHLRIPFKLLQGVGLFPPVASLSVAQLRREICAAGFEIIDERVFGTRPQNPYIVARK